jgi:peptidoglycan-associated lipoprotein
MKRWTMACSLVAACAALLLFCAACTEKQVTKEEAPAPVAEPAKKPRKPVVEEIPPAPAPAQPEVKVSEAPAPTPPKEEPARPSKDAEILAAATPTEPAAGLQPVYFEYDKAVITPEAQETLKKNRDFLMAHPELRVLIEGHCDERGTNEYNLALGERRAAATRRFLTDLGVDPNRMDLISYGEERPVDPASNEAAWAKNRRAEFKKL